ncbi:uncharacterized protein LOC130894762 [Diorhabda carinulata]|uniref:uncharacterized protein LOC130894762 n=1 Tax=Diorhabda carinulata TaxID=1163345 RepID=UPI0025A0B8C3|nr:uncharacterized protein LOC130894762 [Diorhabda carinulata]XP_057657720.1 uncharacterized protein LOC130894762 [Diorhabda carinulata]XP_057657721.1 uncharacterized protein LOC130894762 [Diorhabda carinulata]XP_057657722.1 uncharacterized protein LOC130894762 [Diorhabda carinulata]XP_057657723.1 uncharacterized protein LOC130894762 [Diorhabda carinulata]XP_057657724.1 uncharacterized protein LOC130894762 [Diorhabda carinulata]
MMDIERTQSHDLKCSICKNYLNIPPVLTSDDGKITKCGRCQYKGPILNNRNTLYESIGSKLRFPCMNPECKDRMSWNEVQRHERSCQFRRISCPFWNCRDKNISFILSNDVSHFETCHPGSMHYGPITLNFKVITHHQSFIKLLIINDTPFLMFIHCLKFGETAVLIGVFSCDNRQHDFEIKIRSDTDSNRFTLFKEKVPLYDEQQHCLYCLQNICFLEHHKFSKKHPDNQQQRYELYSNIDVAAAKSLLQTENLMFDISVTERRNEENGSIISRNSD